MLKKYKVMSTKVVFFVTNLDSGGLENYLYRFLNIYASTFTNVIIFCKGGRGGILEEKFQELRNVEIIKQNVGNFHPHHYIKLALWLKKHKDYVVCDFTGNFSAPVLCVASTLQIKKRISFYRSSSNRFQENAIKLFVNKIYKILVYKYATDIFANSKYAFRYFFKDKKHDARFKVIFNGVDIESFIKVKSDLREELGISKSTFVIGHTGRFNPAKNHKTLIKVAKIILSIKTNVVFILCGKGVQSNLKSWIKGYEENIFLFENRTDVSKFLNTCDAFVFPSITEGQPNSLIEAWIMGLPFVASDIPPIKEIIPVDFYSSLISPTDEQLIVKALSSIIEGDFNIEKQGLLKAWARNTFDAKKRFREFYLELVS